MAMSRKDYVMLAAEIRGVRIAHSRNANRNAKGGTPFVNDPTDTVLDGLTERLILKLRADNRRFDAKRFRKATQV